MADYPLIEDDTATGPPAVVEAKVVASSLVALVVSVVVAALNAVQADSALLGGLPPWAQALILAVAPPLATFLAGYAKTSNRV